MITRTHTRTLSLVLLAMAGTLPAAHAQSTDAPTQRVEIRAAPEAGVAFERDQVFEMETGKRLVVEPVGQSLRVRYARQPWRMLKPDGAGRYTSADGHMVLHAAGGAYGEVHQVRLSMPADWM